MPNPQGYQTKKIDLEEVCKTARPSEIARQGAEDGRRRKSYEVTQSIYRKRSRDDYAVLHNQTVSQEGF